MKKLLLLFLLCFACTSNHIVDVKTPAEILVPTVTAWCDTVPHDRYYYSVDTFRALEFHAISEPDDFIFWQLRILINEEWILIHEGESEPGLIAGQRWYFNRSDTRKLLFTAWTKDDVATATWPIQ